jgi:hypothetical protein
MGRISSGTLVGVLMSISDTTEKEVPTHAGAAKAALSRLLPLVETGFVIGLALKLKVKLFRQVNSKGQH